MTKQKKKRSKRYTGQDAKVNRPTVLKVQAEERSAFKEWWLTWGKAVKVLSGIFAVLVAVIVLVIGIIGILV